MKAFLIYLVFINAVAFFLMLMDKYKAKKNLWRIRESILLGIAVAGGSVGILAGMYTAHHKTMHLKFALGVPIILALQFILFAVFYR